MYMTLKLYTALALEPASGPDARDASDLPCDNERVHIVAALVRVHSLHVTERLADVEIGDDAIAAEELPAERHRLPRLLGDPCLAQARLACGHLARAMELAEAPAQKPHGLDVAQHPDQLLLVQLERRQWHTKLFPLSKVPDRSNIVIG